MIFDEQLDINLQSSAHQFSKVENKLSVSIRYQDIEKIMQFSDVLIEKIYDFIYFHRWDENEVSHLEELIDKDENVSMKYSHEDTEIQWSHIIHENISSFSFERREWS
jgi:hypothetical protein